MGDSQTGSADPILDLFHIVEIFGGDVGLVLILAVQCAAQRIK
jgi:hypothetical protein